MLIRNCLLQPRNDETLFVAREEGDRFVTEAFLDGYAIIPVEVYEGLLGSVTDESTFEKQT